MNHRARLAPLAVMATWATWASWATWATLASSACGKAPPPTGRRNTAVPAPRDAAPDTWQQPPQATPDAPQRPASARHATSATRPDGPLPVLPDLPPTATAEAFPPFGAVPAPPGQEEALDHIVRSMGSRDVKRRRQAEKALRTLLSAPTPNPALALFLAASPKPALVKASFELWVRLRKHPHLVPAMVAVMGHPLDHLRYRALQTLVFEYGRPEVARSVAPYLRRLTRDPSCLVRHAAYGYLAHVEGTLGRPHRDAALAALEDPCPAVRLHGLTRATDDPSAVTDALRARIAALARSSAFFRERCEAYRALARLKHPEAEAILAQGLAVAADTTLVVELLAKVAGSISLTGGGSLPACAAAALERLTGRREPGDDRDKVAAWRATMARKKLAPRPPERLCLGDSHCRRAREVCLHLACTPFAEAEAAYWKHRRAEGCEGRKRQTPWHNLEPSYTVATGFGLDSLGPWRIRTYLAKASPDAFAKQEKAVAAEPCK